MSPEQCRAARAWLNWSQDQLAVNARVSNSTVRDFEAGRRVPIANNLSAIKRSLEDAGIQFLFSKDEKPWGIAERAATHGERVDHASLKRSARLKVKPRRS